MIAKSAVKKTMSSPKHLIILIHGVNGSASDCEYIGRELRTANQSQDLYIAAPTVNEGLSHDGIERGSKRYLKWLISHCAKYPSINEISIIGHSLGGLYARCLVGLMWQKRLLTQQGGKLKPHTLIALATPHLPPRQHDWLFGRKLGSFMLQALIGKSGQDLLLQGSDKVDDKPILEKMASDDEFIEPLKHFTRLITYANAHSDPVINYGNAALSYTDICPKKTKDLFKDHPKPLVFHHETVEKDVLPGVTEEMPDEEMMDKLCSLNWTRYGILPSRGVLAHADMVIKFKSLSIKHGEPVIKHIASHFTPEQLAMPASSSTLTVSSSSTRRPSFEGDMGDSFESSVETLIPDTSKRSLLFN